MSSLEDNVRQEKEKNGYMAEAELKVLWNLYVVSDLIFERY